MAKLSTYSLKVSQMALEVGRISSKFDSTYKDGNFSFSNLKIQKSPMLPRAYMRIYAHTYIRTRTHRGSSLGFLFLFIYFSFSFIGDPCGTSPSNWFTSNLFLFFFYIFSFFSSRLEFHTHSILLSSGSRANARVRTRDRSSNPLEIPILILM